MKLQKNLHHNKLEGNMTMCALITFTEVPLKTWAKPGGGGGTRTRRRKLSTSHTQTTSEKILWEKKKSELRQILL
jgi:hypothetical protein